jgi:ppGpp synthetase/RelA/SpoT-type nucleotidyltranferase
VASAEELDGLRDRYAGSFGAYERASEAIRVKVESALQARGITTASVEARAKTVSSLVKKAIHKRYANPWLETTDKIGVRITTVYASDMPAVEAAVLDSGFQLIKREDKRERLPPGQLGYLATHLDVSFKQQDGLDAEDCRCEIQIRSAAESAWAYAVHDLMYKGPVEADGEWQRSAYRLLALVELFDCEVQRLREKIMSDPGYPQGRVLEALEREFFQLTAVEFNSDLTRDVVECLLPLLGGDDTSAPASVVRAFVEANQEKLARLYKNYLSDDRHVLMSQPESLLIFLLLDRDKYKLVEAWGQCMPPTYLQGLSEVWGKPVDSGEEDS